MTNLGASIRYVIAMGSVLLLHPIAAHGQVRVEFTDGLVTVSARNATMVQILGEWARVGRTRVVNADRLTGPPVTLELVAVTEVSALETLLRGAGGYLLAPRAAAETGASRYDRVFVVPQSSAPRSAPPPTAPTPPAFQPTGPARPATRPFEPPDDADGQARPVPGVRPAGDGSQPPASGNAGEGGRATLPGIATPSSRVPTSPVGVARPGMVVPTPPSPGGNTTPER